MAKKTTKKSKTAGTSRRSTRSLSKTGKQTNMTSARTGSFISKTTDKAAQRASRNGAGDSTARELTTKDLTLRAFRMTYESHHRRKAS